jgi:hypothetical protein
VIKPRCVSQPPTQYPPPWKYSTVLLGSLDFGQARTAGIPSISSFVVEAAPHAGLTFDASLDQKR